MAVFVDDDGMIWKHLSNYWPFAKGIHLSPRDLPQKGPVMQSFDIIFVFTQTSCWINNRVLGDLRCHGAMCLHSNENKNIPVAFWDICLMHCGICERGLFLHEAHFWPWFHCSFSVLRSRRGSHPSQKSGHLWGPHRTLDYVHGIWQGHLHQWSRHHRRRRILTYMQLSLNIQWWTINLFH